jgi:hypothetical protein
LIFPFFVTQIYLLINPPEPKIIHLNLNLYIH